jgi:hypothetical protein
LASAITHPAPYWFDTDAAVVEVLRGGTVGPMYRTPEPGIYRVDTMLTRPLSAGETASLEYRITLALHHAATPRVPTGHPTTRRQCRDPRPVHT